MGQVVFTKSYTAPISAEPIRGKITAYRQKDGTFKFRWTISHFYKYAEDAGFYRSSVTTRNTLESCRALMDQDAKGFENAQQIDPNPRW